MRPPSGSAQRRGPWLLPAELVLTAVLSTALYWLLRMEFVWVLGGLAAGWAVTAAFRRSGRPHSPLPATRKLGQVLIGIALGPVLAAQSLAEPLPHLALLLGAVVVALAGGVVVAAGYSRGAGVDRLSAGLATLPGGIGIMSSVAAERGGSPSLVALVQGVRVAVVVSAVPAILLLGGASATEPADVPALLPESVAQYAAWGLMTAGAFGAAAVAHRLKVPVASLLGPMVLGLVAAVVVRLVVGEASVVQVPYLHSVAGQALLGITVGEYLAQDSHVPRLAVLGGMVGVAATMAISLVTALLLTALTPWSFLTCVLMTAPGGAPEMIVLAAATPSDLHLVVLAQMTRQIAVNALMPLWLKLFGGFASPT